MRCTATGRRESSGKDNCTSWASEHLVKILQGKWNKGYSKALSTATGKQNNPKVGFFFFGGRKAGKEVAKMNLMFKNNYIVKIYIHLKRNATYLEDLYKINIEEKQECHPVTVREEPPWSRIFRQRGALFYFCHNIYIEAENFCPKLSWRPWAWDAYGKD